jgi:hypothetical protein
MRKTIRKKEIILFAVILAAALISWYFLSRDRSSKEYASIKITVSGEDFGTYSLGEDQVIKIGGTNTCRIQNGQVKMIEANCPDHLCINMGRIKRTGQSIICLPNRVTVEIRGEKEAEDDYDTIVG